MTAVLMLFLSFLLKTVGQAFLIVSAVLFIAAGAAFLSLSDNRGGFLMCLVLFLYCLKTVSVMTGDIAYARSISGKTDCINATVITAPVNIGDNSYGYCTVKINFSSDGVLKKGAEISLFAEGTGNLEIGDLLECEVAYSSFDREYALSNYSDGIYLRGVCKNGVICLGKSRGVYGFAGRIRSYVMNRIVSCSDNYHILLSMITGERGYISSELYGRVIDAGVSHILVVSGMHLALLCGGLERFFRLICRKALLRDIIVLIFVFIMSVICGFGMSILRAAIVYAVRILYRIIGRRQSSVHSLSLAVVLVLLIHPYAFHSLAFQLSYSATFGILVLSKRFDRRLSRFAHRGTLARNVAKALSVSLSAYIATLPVCTAAFGKLSLVAVPVNILLSIPSSLMLSLCVMGIALGFIPFLERLFIMLADILADYFIKTVDFASSLSFATFIIRNERLLTVGVLLCYLLIYIVKTKPYRVLKKR